MTGPIVPLQTTTRLTEVETFALQSGWELVFRNLTETLKTYSFGRNGARIDLGVLGGSIVTLRVNGEKRIPEEAMTHLAQTLCPCPWRCPEHTGELPEAVNQ